MLRRSSDLPGGFPPSRRAGIGTQVSAPGRHASAAWVWLADSLPIWSCSVWGLPCHHLYRRRGALLPHLFTLTPGEPVAVFSLWHWPSLSLDAQIPDVIRHTALRSSDFPLPKHASASAATARRTCNPMLVHLAEFVSRLRRPLSFLQYRQHSEVCSNWRRLPSCAPTVRPYILLAGDLS